MRGLPGTLCLSSLLLAGCSPPVLTVGPLVPHPYLYLARSERPLWVDLQAVPDSFRASYNKPGDPAPAAAADSPGDEPAKPVGFDVTGFRQTILRGFQEGLRASREVRERRPDAAWEEGDTVQLVEVQVRLDPGPTVILQGDSQSNLHYQSRLRVALRFRARLLDEEGDDVDRSFGDLQGGAPVMRIQPDETGGSRDAADFGPALQALVERMIEQIARDLLVPPRT